MKPTNEELKEEDEIINKIINRELRMRCLNCGVSLYNEIMNYQIHIHLCRNCRLLYMGRLELLNKKNLDKLKEMRK